MNFRVHPGLESKMVPIETVQQYPGNPNNGDIEAISESIQVNGLYAGVIVQRSTGYILAGNHRYAALASLGATHIPVDYVDVDEVAAKRIVLADNRTTRLGRDDPSDLLQLLKDLNDSDLGLIGTGFTIEDMGEIVDETENIGFGEPVVAVGYQVVVDLRTEDEANLLADSIRGEYPDVRVIEL